MKFFFLAIVLAAVVVGVIALSRPRPIIAVVFHGGKPRVTRGKVPAAFLDNCDILGSELRIRRGTIRGVRRRDGRISLEFSRGIPGESHQRFRNVWNLKR